MKFRTARGWNWLATGTGPRTLLLGVCLAGLAIAGEDTRDAIELGNKFTSPQALWKAVGNQYRVKLETAWHSSGGKEIAVVTPFLRVAIAAATAKAQMREFTVEDAEKLPKGYLVHLYVSSIGAQGQRQINHLFLGPVPTVIFENGDELTHADKPTAASAGMSEGLMMYRVDSIGNTALVSPSLDFRGAHLSRSFAFSKRPSGTIILIDSKGHKYRFSKEWPEMR